MNDAYKEQVNLLLDVLPYVAQEKNFALKGGTAINLFVFNMPRLSVDIDLTYLPFDARDTALINIAEALHRIKKNIEQKSAGIIANLVPQKDGTLAKIACQNAKAQIIIEVNTTIRGCLIEPKLLGLTDVVQEQFNKFVNMAVVSEGELFGGKVCAALDRQHPRDLYDINNLFKNQGITHEIKLGFMASLISHPRPIHELLHPNLQNQKAVFEQQFMGMALEEFSYQDFESVRKKLINKMAELFDENDKLFLLSFHTGEPNWDLFQLEKLKEMPAVKWKLLNIKKLKNNNKIKHEYMLRALNQAFEST